MGQEVSPGKGQSMRKGQTIRKDHTKPLKKVRVMQALSRQVANNTISARYRKIWLRSMIEPRAYLECFRRRDSRLIDRPRRAIFFHGVRCPHPDTNEMSPGLNGYSLTLSLVTS